MEIWIIIGLPIAGIVFLLDYLLRKTKWNENTSGEKTSLILNMVSVVPYMILSVFGIFMGITGNGTETVLGDFLYNLTIQMAGFYFVIAIGAVIGTLILRKIGKIKASIWVNVIAILYIVLVSAVNSIASELL